MEPNRPSEAPYTPNCPRGTSHLPNPPAKLSKPEPSCHGMWMAGEGGNRHSNNDYHDTTVQAGVPGSGNPRIQIKFRNTLQTHSKPIRPAMLKKHGCRGGGEPAAHEKQSKLKKPSAQQGKRSTKNLLLFPEEKLLCPVPRNPEILKQTKSPRCAKFKNRLPGRGGSGGP